MIVFDGVFHKIVHGTVEQQIAVGDYAVAFFLDQFDFFLTGNRIQVAEGCF